MVKGVRSLLIDLFLNGRISPELFMSFFAYFILDTGIAGLSPRALGIQPCHLPYCGTA